MLARCAGSDANRPLVRLALCTWSGVRPRRARTGSRRAAHSCRPTWRTTHSGLLASAPDGSWRSAVVRSVAVEPTGWTMLGKTSRAWSPPCRSHRPPLGPCSTPPPTAPPADTRQCCGQHSTPAADRGHRPRHPPTPTTRAPPLSRTPRSTTGRPRRGVGHAHLPPPQAGNQRKWMIHYP
jgi:hypothetical protein